MEEGRAGDNILWFLVDNLERLFFLQSNLFQVGAVKGPLYATPGARAVRPWWAPLSPYHESQSFNLLIRPALCCWPTPFSRYTVERFITMELSPQQCNETRAAGTRAFRMQAVYINHRNKILLALMFAFLLSGSENTPLLPGPFILSISEQTWDINT